MNEIPKEYIQMFDSLKNNIANSIDNTNFIPDYISDAENTICVSGEIKWGIDLPSTVYLNMIEYYNNEKSFNIFFEKFTEHNGYNNFLYGYFIRRCALIHSCTILDDDSIDLLKKYVAIYKEYNNGRFNKECFTKRDVDEDFENSNLNNNLSFIESIYNKNMLKNDQSRLILFNYPYFCNDFIDQDYTQQFFSPYYELYWNISNEYISKRRSPNDLLNLLEVFELLKFEGRSVSEKQSGGSERFNRFIRHYGIPLSNFKSLQK